MGSFSSFIVHAVFQFFLAVKVLFSDQTRINKHLFVEPNPDIDGDVSPRQFDTVVWSCDPIGCERGSDPWAESQGPACAGRALCDCGLSGCLYELLNHPSNYCGNWATITPSIIQGQQTERRNVGDESRTSAEISGDERKERSEELKDVCLHESDSASFGWCSSAGWTCWINSFSSFLLKTEGSRRVRVLKSNSEASHLDSTDLYSKCCCRWRLNPAPKKSWNSLKPDFFLFMVGFRY